jgi:hypothetical protein
MKLFFVCVLCYLLCSCGEQCGITAEPVTAIQFPFKTEATISKVSILGVLQDVPKEGIQPTQRINTFSAFFPLNLNSDSTTYIFTRPNRIDTLTVYYKKRIYNASNTCGYVLDLEAPTSGKTYSTTFKKIEVEYYSYYIPPREKPYPSPDASGIIVKIDEL